MKHSHTIALAALALCGLQAAEPNTSRGTADAAAPYSFSNEKKK